MGLPVLVHYHRYGHGMVCWVCAGREDWGVAVVEEDMDVVAGVCEVVAATLVVAAAAVVVAKLGAADAVVVAGAALHLPCQNRIEQLEGAVIGFQGDP